ncbi:hypothetical protein [Streptomyces sp. H27-H5]|uniref:hypothetical protein n=1 Tax=Streptomyces sp. H27-H5 TaxID=2996460 RepID=UPI00226E49A4|nr:hypothetical protein [Streptomyces sp. H27-H5]MCY0960834.1 hypothetical protein [Streptomyces sp. H27-H5]
MTHPRAETCCVCGDSDVVYHNYREQPFCWPCANCHCTQDPCVRTGVNDPAVSADTAGSPDRRASIRHLLDRASRGVLTVAEAELLRGQVEAEQRAADQRAKQAATTLTEARSDWGYAIGLLAQAVDHVPPSPLRDWIRAALNPKEPRT